MKLWQDAQRLQDLFLEDGVDDEKDNGENIIDFYDKLQEIGAGCSKGTNLKDLGWLGVHEIYAGTRHKIFQWRLAYEDILGKRFVC